MKRLLFKTLSILVAIVFLSVQTFKSYAFPAIAAAPVSSESDFFLDTEQLNAELAGLNELEAWLETHEGATFADLTESGNPLISNLDNSASPWESDGQENDRAPLGIPSFLWGCFLGIVGILLVYIFTDENKAEAKKAAWGCAAATAASVMIYIFFFVLFISLESDPHYY